MGLLNFFKPVPKWSPDRIREFIKTRQPDEYNLIDVRQPGEYEKGHLPGAQLIPIGELPSRMKELDPEKPTITY
ncbi:MAG: rhodanese-like domain-containing protein [bacterium]